uniref:Uncharacterized protein n=1 Tax=Chromera velia CCMP2878 TaxID=1169474 RepID=A0A0G4I7U3_9ALVE|mmetsp:Transcript_11194/g.21678  ORF Transcript_11194/g.21678 Transcript_11194/m.21678 type:complete len:96 (-) Transcript_11194:389-676(-)|eukprot:Cvel_11675.t1-p1 / transcript=Cvel_11675.t1 / gene=Cvel_11675 / organism=Chromera_velia_CCMP2878 / gene_product=hypothetical protein / transcript_product=hypothetical protein / location=Cvel_scaffold740:32314-33955(+) / protein_length=95 / sequence_SO=supercontig / SO=protein_coding / is_pseudo=false
MPDAKAKAAPPVKEKEAEEKKEDEEKKADKDENTFEDEDDFEEFERYGQVTEEAKPDAPGKWDKQWDATGWDDEDPKDDFTKQLKAELDKNLGGK